MYLTNYNTIPIDAARIIVAEANRLADRKVWIDSNPMPENYDDFDHCYNYNAVKASGSYSLGIDEREDLSYFWREFDRLEKAYLKDKSLPR